MVNNIQSFELLQTEAVSSEKTVTFDSTSGRMKSVHLSLSGTDLDRECDYFLPKLSIDNFGDECLSYLQETR